MTNYTPVRSEFIKKYRNEDPVSISSIAVSVDKREVAKKKKRNFPAWNSEIWSYLHNFAKYWPKVRSMLNRQV